MTAKRQTRWAMIALLTTATASCNALLDIEEARVDPRLSDNGEVVSDDPPVDDALDVDPSGPAPDEASPADSIQSTNDAGSNQSGNDGDEAADDEFDDDQDDDQDDTSLAEDDHGDDNDDTKETDDMGNNGDQPGKPVADNADPPANELDAGPSPEESLCETYCDEIMELCTDDLEQYRDRDQCMTVCELLPAGELTSEENVNTAACRLRYASKARYAAGTEHEAYCRQAGPGGDGRCGENCEGYCALMQGVCTRDVSTLYNFPSFQVCMQTCEELPTSAEAYTTASATISDGNHVQCRLFHVTSAAMLDAEEHCEHAMGFTLCEATEESEEEPEAPQGQAPGQSTP